MSKRKHSNTCPNESPLKKRKCETDNKDNDDSKDGNNHSLASWLKNLKSLSHIPQPIIAEIAEYGNGMMATCWYCDKEEHIDCKWNTYLRIFDGQILFSELLLGNERWVTDNGHQLCSNCLNCQIFTGNIQ